VLHYSTLVVTSVVNLFDNIIYQWSVMNRYKITKLATKVTNQSGVVEHWPLFQNAICDVYKSQHARSELEIGLML
jgi:hypothetical protein